MKKPYLKKIDDRGVISIWLVDGQYIRTNLDKEFTNFGHHYTCKSIPLDEFWIDREQQQSEVRFYIYRMLTEYRLMVEGKSRCVAMDAAGKAELLERKKSKLFKKLEKFRKNKKELVASVHKELLKEYSKKVNVWVVRGELVRDFYYIDFTEGGHDRVYSFIPDKEIWLDDGLYPAEREFVLLHELYERRIMSAGHCFDIRNGTLRVNKNYTEIYAKAHKAASRLEYFYRHHRSKLAKRLKIEIKKA
ncbi:MAG: hypothetical protein WC310_01935 [Patescibacteria group bacterium]|jgi:hypothetical protein